MVAGLTRNIVDPNGIQGLSGIRMTDKLEDISKMKRPGKRASSPERWELAQLKHAGVLKVTEYPDFDEEGAVGLLTSPTPAIRDYQEHTAHVVLWITMKLRTAKKCLACGMCRLERPLSLQRRCLQGIMHVDDDVEEEFEIDLSEVEPAFLAGQTSKQGVEVSPIKIVKNPDGSLQRAAMTQSALAKERRELKEQQQRTAAEVPAAMQSSKWTFVFCQSLTRRRVCWLSPGPPSVS